ncbi:MAG: TolC family outer membrane protein, partial [Dongiaceae bacterium]
FFASSEVQRQRARVRSAAYRVGETAEFVGLDAVEGFLEVLRHRARVDIAEQNVQVHRDILASVQRRADIGGGGIGDVRQAEARQAAARSALVQTQGDLRDAEALFIRVVGQAPESLSDPTVPAGMLPTDSEQAVAAAVENSPTIAFARADVETAEADVRQQEASLYPDFRAELGGTVVDNVDGRTDTEYDATAMLVMRWNLYRGGADAARVREFKHRLAEANDTQRISERNVSENARVSWNAMQVAKANVVVLNENVEANQRTREIYRQQFDIGQRGLLDLLDSENELFLSRENLVTARYAELFANYRLLATSGALVKSLGLAAPEAAQLPAD